ncbi:uncharacterized protein B0J16DRAFT_336446 [Fusarium flagelliforme]|uniref:Uncharacterized protein n=1 Tax=Fusarium flagelliforme TaxID=2675880 RepID=A0A395N3Z5_9HYPO|nr:uncharacterized protein B0J16DRAFT_336446 [Fusarium flagelliforme]KAH7188097.1 hypothetical protein B0J16DRAFT_336446 [Fusarium flagelliforme]RFN54533.1 hypothetical protein FIE12Z_1188 [Fusarium flagelliforme]
MTRLATAFALGLLMQTYGSHAAVIARGGPDFGSCSDPTIAYVSDQDHIAGSGYKPANNESFPHVASNSLSFIAGFICNNLQTVCGAPAATVEICKAAAAGADGKEGQDAAAAFNKAITTPSSSPAPESSSVTSRALAARDDVGTPSQDSADAGYTITPSINMKFSTSTTIFEEFTHLDPVWWFDTYILADGQPALCDETPRRMPGDHWITFSCEGADPRIVPMMKDALTSFVQNTMYDTSLTTRIFKQLQAVACSDEYDTSTCKETTMPAYLKARTYMPSSVHIATAINIPGAGGALSGNLRYTITKSPDNNCGVCGFLSTGGGLTSTIAGISEILFDTASLIAPGIAVANAAVSFTCMSSC